jgi:DNA-binding LytR/AlgR family response regulator
MRMLLHNLVKCDIIIVIINIWRATMLYKIAICDDEEKERNGIHDYLTRFSIGADVEFTANHFSSGEELVRRYKSEQSSFDIIFLDIEMKELNGIQTAEKIRVIPDRNVLIIFITSYPEYMQDSFDVQASQYLSKPLSYELFEEKLKKVISYLDELETNITVMSPKDGNVILHLDDIICFETDKSKTLKSNLLVTTTNGELLVKGKISDLENQLQDKYFVTLHRSVLANMKYIKRFATDTVEFTNGKIVELSRRKVTEVKEAFSKYTVMRCRK